MIRKFIPLVPIIAASLFACGAAEPETTKTETSQKEAEVRSPEVKSTVDSAKSTASGAVFRPVGVVDVSTLSTPTSSPESWRKVPADKLILLQTARGAVLIEMTPEFTPAHAAQFSALAKSGHFNGLPFHRVIDGFMAQAGDTTLVSRPNPTTSNIVAEFYFRRSPETKMTITGERRSADAGFINGFQVASQNPLLASMTADGKVEAWPLHCPGAVAAARLGNDINSANAQFYITMGYPQNLEKNYTVWGRVRAGLRSVFKIKKGEPPMPPDLIEKFSLVSDLEAEDAPQVWVMNTNSEEFSNYLEGLRSESGKLPDVCDIDVPVIVSWP